MMMKKRYPKTTMLVGEYGILIGGESLTIPLPFPKEESGRQTAFDPSEVPGGYRFFLLDSGVHLEADPLKAHFFRMMEDSGFASSVRNEYLPLNKKLIESLLGAREADPAMLFRIISDFQYTHFRKMIPENMLDIWIEGQVSNEYYLKINGHGGSFVLGIAHENYMEALVERWKEKIILIG